MDEEARKKLNAKRFNEHVKLLVTTSNAIALITAGTGAIQPIIASGATITSKPANWFWIALAVILHLFAQALIRLIRPE
jgi:hypothetical protein